MRTCRNCGTELSDQAAFCHVCGASENGHEASKISKRLNHQVMSRTVFYVLMLALALMGMVVAGLAVRSPGTATQTNNVTRMQLATVTVSFTSSATMTATSITTLTRGGSAATVPVGPPPIWFNQQYCGYPFNPYICNEGPPVTITGYLTNDAPCVNLSIATGQNYVVWNLPSQYPTGGVQVYGFIYPNWPQTQPFPPYPFQTTVCVGTPMWAIPPYIQSA